MVRKLRIACCQFNPVKGRVADNQKTADRLLFMEIGKDCKVDIIVLPEMAFTGYVFDSCEEIKPYVEDAQTGPSVEWARKTAAQYNAHVLVGYPERATGADNTDREVYYNSACMVSPSGELLTTYRKYFLFDTDECWAEPGDSFCSLDVPGLGRVGIGICMDLNYNKNSKDKRCIKYREFADFHEKNGTEILICLLNWLEYENSNMSPLNLALNHILYWITRLSPWCRLDQEAYECFNSFVARNRQSLDSESASSLRVFVACNRIGTEEGKVFCGSSCVMHFHQLSAGESMLKSLDNFMPPGRVGILTQSVRLD